MERITPMLLKVIANSNFEKTDHGRLHLVGFIESKLFLRYQVTYLSFDVISLF